MKRLTETELDARIHKFMGRKLAEFPELRGDGTKARRSIEAIARSQTLHWRLTARTL